MKKPTATPDRRAVRKQIERPDPVERFNYERKKRRTGNGLAELALAGDRQALQSISGLWAAEVDRMAQSITDPDRRATLSYLVTALERMGPGQHLKRNERTGQYERMIEGESPNEAFGWNLDPKTSARYEQLFEDSQRARSVAYFQQQGMTVDEAISAANRQLYPGQDREESIRDAYKRSSLKKSR